MSRQLGISFRNFNMQMSVIVMSQLVLRLVFILLIVSDKILTISKHHFHIVSIQCPSKRKTHKHVNYMLLKCCFLLSDGFKCKL